MYTVRGTWTFVFLTVVMLMVQMVPASPEQPREDYTVRHVSTFSDGKIERTVNMVTPGMDKSVSIALPNGARVISATMNITSLPGADPDSDYLENLTIDVGKDGSLEYAFQGKAYGRMGSQSLFSNGAPHLNVSMPSNGGTNATPSVRLPKNATVTSAVMKVSAGSGVGTPGKFLLCAADTESYTQDVQTKLKSFGDVSGVDYVIAQTVTPSLDTLKQYSAVLVWSNYGFTDQNTLGNNLADYIDLGGGVVLAIFTFGGGSLAPTGRFQTGGYLVLPFSGYQSVSGTLGTYDAGHPLMTNVNSFSTTYYRSASSSPQQGVTFVANWSDGAPLVATKECNGVKRVDLGFFPPSSDIISGSWSSATDGKHLMHNALFWAGRKSINCSLDVGNDGSFEYRNLALNTTESIPDVTGQFNAYLAAAQPSGTDAYGNAYVDVPIAMSSNLSGTVQLNNVSIVYQYGTTVDPNPTTGNLTEGLNAVLPADYDTKSTNIPVAIYSTHAGKLRLSNLRIEYVPPVHPAIIVARVPEEPVVLMYENTTLELCITAEDPYDYPMSTSWTLNGRTVLKNYFNMSWYADFDANGTYNVTVSVDNGQEKVATSWLVIVKNVNRKPIIDSFSPEKSFEMDENSSASFELAASDPDNNDITYTWHLDGKRVLSDETTYEYKTTYSSAGKHELKVVVLDSLGDSTTFAWTITVKDVNAGPTITDSSPPGDQVTMSENSSKKFSIVDLSPDMDKQFVQWSLDGNNTGVAGRSYNYSANFESAGTHVVQAQVTDGKLADTRSWTVTVQDVNRAPVAAIASPAEKAEFMLGTDIVLDGSASSDPDSDTLSMSWSEAGKPLGTGNTLTVKLAKGKHIITLGVDDGKKNGIATAQVEIYVRYIDFKATLTVDSAAPVEGKKLVVSARLTNKGDGSVAELPVSFTVDGTEVASTTIESIEPDADFPLEFSWKAVKGDHKLEVTVNGQDFSKMVTVAKKPAAAAPVGGDMTWLIAVVIVAVVAAAIGAVVLAKRKKNAAAQPEGDLRVTERPERTARYEPMRKAPPAHAPRVPPAAAAQTAAAPPSSGSAPDINEETKARETIENLESMVRDAEAAGLDIKKARQSLNIARNFFEMGKYQKAMLYCKMAEDGIG